jgi:hypothetical protein
MSSSGSSTLFGHHAYLSKRPWSANPAAKRGKANWGNWGVKISSLASSMLRELIIDSYPKLYIKLQQKRERERKVYHPSKNWQRIEFAARNI